MESNKKLRFCYIFNENGVRIEIQDWREKLSPFIRSRSQLKNLEDRIGALDKEIFFYLCMLGIDAPPFFIDKEKLHIEVLENIKKSNFMFSESKTKSLKRIFSIPENMLQKCKKNYSIIEPKRMSIIIEKVLSRNIVQTDFFFDVAESNFRIPIDYTFLIPSMDRHFFRFNTEIVEQYNILFTDVVGRAIKRHENYQIDNLLKIDKDSRFCLLYQSKKEQKKCVSFERNSNGGIDFFKYNDSVDKKILYQSILKNYLENKNFVELGENIVFFNEQNIQNNGFVKKLLENTTSDENILFFFNKLYSHFKTISLRNIDKMFRFDLKEHQVESLAWLCSLHKNKIGGALLADEMGLGKTIQAISFFEYLSMNKVLIVSPASLVENWKKEIISFLNISENVIKTEFCNSARIVIVSYEKLRFKQSIDQVYDLLILDETQKIKNNKTLAYKAIERVRRDFTLAITGTPIENSIKDLWNILSTINGNINAFLMEYIQPFVNQDNIDRAIELTIKFFSPIIKQRKKEEILNLPEMKIQTVGIRMNDNEFQEYERIVNIFASALKTKEFARINSIALEGLLRLRQFCSIHNILPETLLAHSLDDTKIKQCLLLIKEIINKKEKVILFSQFTKTLDILEKHLKSYRFVRLDGTMSSNQRKRNIDLFQNEDSAIQIFLISLKAGGVGLTLTNAQNAILFEPWFNPAIEAQAFSRIHRIGQESITKVYRLIYLNTIEEQIDHILLNKSKIATKFSEGLKGGDYTNFAIKYFSDIIH